jgi:GDP-D-mannose dehydratase
VFVCVGITGQDGSYLVELLLDKGYQVLCLPTSVYTADQSFSLSVLIGLLGFRCTESFVVLRLSIPDGE